jgi:hypothetical protein
MYSDQVAVKAANSNKEKAGEMSPAFSLTISIWIGIMFSG